MAARAIAELNGTNFLQDPRFCGQRADSTCIEPDDEPLQKCPCFDADVRDLQIPITHGPLLFLSTFDTSHVESYDDTDTHWHELTRRHVEGE